MSSDSSHSRRNLLALAGVVFGTTTLAGCSSTAADQESTGTADGESNATEAEQSTFDDGETPAPMEMDGLVTVERTGSVEDVVEAISGAIEDNEKLTLMTTVDHAENAASVDRSLPPTTLLLFGNPELGTRLMNERRTVAIDLPQKLLVYEDDDGTFVTYNDPAYLARRHGVLEKAELLETIGGALDTLANAPVESAETG